MIVILIAISLIYVILLIMILKAYYRDNSDLYDRILVLEKRLEDYKREVRKLSELSEFLYNENNKAIMELRKTKADKKEEGECMACRKGKGGRKK